LATDEEGDDVILAIDVVPAVVGAAEDTDETFFVLVTGATAEASNASFPTGAAFFVATDLFLAAAFAVTGELVVAEALAAAAFLAAYPGIAAKNGPLIPPLSHVYPAGGAPIP
jgi:hypothetical protein